MTTQEEAGSPPVGEAGEHTKMYVYIPGCFDVGVLTLKGFTLVANSDLAQMKSPAAVQAGNEELLELLKKCRQSLISANGQTKTLKAQRLVVQLDKFIRSNT